MMIITIITQVWKNDPLLTCDCVRVHPANQQEASWSYRTVGNKTNIIVVILHDSCQHGLPCVIVTVVRCVLPVPPMTPAPIVTTHPMAYSWHLSKGHHHRWLWWQWWKRWSRPLEACQQWGEPSHVEGLARNTDQKLETWFDEMLKLIHKCKVL